MLKVKKSQVIDVGFQTHVHVYQSIKKMSKYLILNTNSWEEN